MKLDVTTHNTRVRSRRSLGRCSVPNFGATTQDSNRREYTEWWLSRLSLFAVFPSIISTLLFHIGYQAQIIRSLIHYPNKVLSKMVSRQMS